MSPEQTIMLEKARQYCDYEERCIHDVRNKLYQWSVQSELIDKIILRLENENYIDEDRYVRAFALGKLRNNKWGRNKILFALRSKKIPDLIIQIGLEELDSEEYLQTLKQVLSSKKIDEKDPYKYKAKLAQYAIQKGFQPSLVWQTINEKN
ncbi:MAG: RecX family transcriptional regulator [Bacteroidetes bacterium]|jgi:regulatory protein|nr:RecX family transcriptional regulator [Bacteroidota bacterium]